MNRRLSGIQRVVVVVVVLAALAGAAYLWGNRVSADVATSKTDSITLSRPESRLHGVAAVRSLDTAGLAARAAPASARLNGIAAVRSLDQSRLVASAPASARLNGVAAVRYFDTR